MIVGSLTTEGTTMRYETRIEEIFQKYNYNLGELKVYLDQMGRAGWQCVGVLAFTTVESGAILPTHLLFQRPIG